MEDTKQNIIELIESIDSPQLLENLEILIKEYAAYYS